MKKSCGTINSRGVRPEDCETLADFIRYFADIPHANWCVDFLEDEDKCCVRGHMGTRDKDIPSNPEEVLEGQLGIHSCGGIHVLLKVNNGFADEYPQEHPKDRVLEFLRDRAKMCPPECGCSRKKK